MKLNKEKIKEKGKKKKRKEKKKLRTEQKLSNLTHLIIVEFDVSMSF